MPIVAGVLAAILAIVIAIIIWKICQLRAIKTADCPTAGSAKTLATT